MRAASYLVGLESLQAEFRRQTSDFGHQMRKAYIDSASFRDNGPSKTVT